MPLIRYMLIVFDILSILFIARLKYYEFIQILNEENFILMGF